MQSIIHPSSTGILNVPVDYKKGQPLPDGALPVSRVQPEGEGAAPQWTTFWRPSAREREALGKGALLEICIVCPFHPPILVEVNGVKA